MWLANLEYANVSLKDKFNWKVMLVIKIWMIGTTMLNEETMHARVGDVKGHSQEVAPSVGMKYDARLTLGKQEVVKQKFLKGIVR